MIFATVGTQLPFPRLVAALEDIAHRRRLEIVVQTADPSYRARHVMAVPFISPRDYDGYVARAAALVAHAGIGTVLSARRLRKPLIIFPRRADLNEHRNDHQLATARALFGVKGIYCASEAEELETLLAEKNLEAGETADHPGRDRLVGRIRSFIDGER